jgi:dynactin complex subunit
MTRKTLSDLVKQEAQKPDESEAVDSNLESDVEAIASKLKDMEAESKHREDALHSEINRLKEEILDQKKHIANLQIELGQTDRIKQEYAEAKAVILKLTEPSPAIARVERVSLPTTQNYNGDSDIGSWLG